MPDLTIDQLTIALAAAAGAALLALLITLFLAFRLRRVRRDYVVLRGDRGTEDVVAAVGRAIKRVDELDRRVDSVWADQQGLLKLGQLGIQKFGLVRYDAFDEMGGRISFSVALLDDLGDGIVFTSINGRTETRTYAKEIRRYDSEHHLSEEERSAIAAAVAGYGRGESAKAVSQAR